jgi:gluconolactonase
MKTILTLLSLLAGAMIVSGANFDIRDEAEFRKIISVSAPVDASVDGVAPMLLKKLAGNLNFIEGPIWIPVDEGHLIFSDIPADELKKWSKLGGLSTFRKPSNNANGNCLDREGRLVTCEHGARRVSMTDKEGMVHTVVDRYQGKRLNSPNDAVVKSDGTIWFTDPDYGLKSPQDKEQPGNYVYRFDSKSKDLKAIITDFDKPNGLCFSPDETRLYVADSGRPRHIRVFEVQKDGTLINGRVFCMIDKGGPDGIRADSEGRIFSSAGDGVQIFSPAGKLIGKILVPEAPANLCFGGKEGKTLFITARKSLYSIELLVKGDK